MLIYVVIGVVLTLIGIYRNIKIGELTSKDFEESGQLIAGIIGFIFAVATWPIQALIGIIIAIKLKYY